jgi:hypothetical protein
LLIASPAIRDSLAGVVIKQALRLLPTHAALHAHQLMMYKISAIIWVSPWPVPQQQRVLEQLPLPTRLASLRILLF